MVYGKVTKVLKNGTVTGTYGFSQNGDQDFTFSTTLAVHPQLDKKDIKFTTYIAPNFKGTTTIMQGLKGKQFTVNFVGLEVVES